VAADLAHALLDLARTEDAVDACRIAEETGASDDVVTQVELLAARARILGQQGDLDAAQRVAREAVEQAEASEYAQLTAVAHLALGDILLRAGNRGEAAEEWRWVMSAEEQRGNQLFARRLRRQLAAIEAGADPWSVRPGD
jgi:tetratricopeptide (TPR) repeat protein